MAFKKLKVPKHHKKAAKVEPVSPVATPVTDTPDPQAKDLPIQADHLLADPKNVELFENVLSQINAFYDLAFSNGREVLPIFVGVTRGGLMIELSAVRDKSAAEQPVGAQDLNVFTYMIGTELKEDIKPRELAEVNMVKGQEQIRLQSAEYPMPGPKDGKAMAKWRFTEAETIQLQTMGIYEIQPENYDQISYGNGIKELGGTEEPIIPIQHFGPELK